MPVMHTAIPCTGNTADQAVNIVHVQLGAAKHLTRPLTHAWVAVPLRYRYCNAVLGMIWRVKPDQNRPDRIATEYQ
jgi:hypothetical protein